MSPFPYQVVGVSPSGWQLPVWLLGWHAGCLPFGRQVCTFVWGVPGGWAVARLVLSWHAGCPRLGFPQCWPVAEWAQGVTGWLSSGRMAGVSPVVGSCPFEDWSWVGGVSPCPDQVALLWACEGGPQPLRCGLLEQGCWGDWWGSPPPFSSILDLAGGPRGERAVLEQRIRGVQ